MLLEYMLTRTIYMYKMLSQQQAHRFFTCFKNNNSNTHCLQLIFVTLLSVYQKSLCCVRKKHKCKHSHITASVLCMPHLTSLILDSKAPKWTMTALKISIGGVLNQIKWAKNFERGEGFISSSLEMACPSLWSNNNQINQRHTAWRTPDCGTLVILNMC